MSHTWYVTIEVKPGALPRPRHPRLSSTFETEAEAKDFARAKLRKGLIVFRRGWPKDKRRGRKKEE